MKVYVDTNILVDLICSREEFLADAQDLFALGNHVGNEELDINVREENPIYLQIMKGMSIFAKQGIKKKSYGNNGNQIR